jgi:type I restriction enzyme S subunit
MPVAKPRPGYKQTEVGVIPADWVPRRIGSLGEVIRGASPRPKGDPRYYGGNVPRLMVEDITRDKHWVIPQIDFLTEEGAKLSRLCRRGTIIAVCSGTPAAVGLPAILAVDACIHDGILAIVRLVNDVSVEYLFHQLRSLQLKLYDSATHGGTFVNLTTEGFRDFTVVCPPTLSEQKAIATALSDADGLIESLQKLIAKKRQIKHGTMQELLTGQRRLPGFSGKWETVRAKDIGRFQGGSGFPTRFQGHVSGEYPFFKVSDMNNQGNETFMVSANNYVSESLRKVIGSVLFPKYSIVFAKVGAAVFLERKKILAQPSCLDNNMAAFVLDSKRSDFRFIHFLMINMRFGDLVSTTALPALNGNTLSKIKFMIPHLDEQSAIVKTLSDIDAEIVALQSKLAKARQIKQGMMQELLTGRVRLI